MKITTKRIFSLLLVLFMLASTVTVFPMSVFAGADDAAEGMTFDSEADADVWRMRKSLQLAPYTISAWIKVDSATAANERVGYVVSNSDGGNTDYTFYGNETYRNRTISLEILQNGYPRLYYGADNNGGITKQYVTFKKDKNGQPINVGTGEWLQLTVVKEASRVVLYIDGEEVQSIADTFEYYSDVLLQPFAFGGCNTTNNLYPFKGNIKGLAMYSRPLSAAEVKGTYDNGYATVDSLLVNYDVSNVPTDNYIADLSGNGYYAAKSTYVSDIDAENNVTIGVMGSGTLDGIPYNPSDKSYAYSFAVVGDTQYMTKYDAAKGYGNLSHVYDWILGNVSSKKIKYVFGLGDITDSRIKPEAVGEWELAHAQISRLNGIVPYSVVRGNHDNLGHMNTYFANDAYMSQFKDPDITDQSKCFYAEGDVRSAYTKFTVGNTKYLLVVLDDNPTHAVLDWAGEIVASNPDHRVIITTHTYLGHSGDHIYGDSNTQTEDPNSLYGYATSNIYKENDENDGREIWEKLVSRYSNIFLVLCGHDNKLGGTDIVKVQREGVNGNIVTEMLICPQNGDMHTMTTTENKKALGMVAMLYFSEDGQDVRVEYISTVKTKTVNNGTSDYVMHGFNLNLFDHEADYDDVTFVKSESGKDTYAFWLTNGVSKTFTVSAGVTVSSVAKTSDGEHVDVYTVSLSDGSTVKFTVANGNILTSTDGMTFAGKEDYQLPSNLTVVPKTYEAWVCHDGKTSSSVMIGNYQGSVSSISFYIRNNSPYLYGPSGTLSFTEVKLEKGVWAYVAIVIDGNKAYCYVNGVKLAQVYDINPDKWTDDFVSSLPFQLGNDNGSATGTRKFRGQIGSVSLYSDVRTEEEILADMKKVNTGDENIILHYDLFANADKAIIVDETGNANTAVVNGFSSNVKPSDSDGITLPQKETDAFKMNDCIDAMPYSIETWIKVPQDLSKRNTILSNFHSGSYGFVFEINANGNPRFWYGTTSGVASDNVFKKVDVRTGEWIQLAIVKEREYVVCYVNGTEAQRIAANNEYDSKNIREEMYFVLGENRRDGQEVPFQGMFGSAAMYNIALTAEQIAECYVNGVDANNASLIAYYNVCGKNAPINDVRIEDLSGNGNDFIRRTTVAGYQVALEGNIGVKVHVTLPVVDYDKLFAKFTVDGVVTVVPFSEAEISDHGYTFKGLVAAAQMTSEIKIEIYYGDILLASDTTSVAEYAKVILDNKDNNAEYTKAQAIVKAMLNYGAAAQTQFGVNLGNLANSIVDVTVGNNADKINEAAKSKVTGTVNGVTYKSTTLGLESETALYHFFDVTDTDISKYTVVGADEIVMLGNVLRVKKAGIEAANLSTEYAVSVTYGGETITVSANAMAYAKAVVNSSAVSDTLKTLMNALYEYNAEMVEYNADLGA